LRKFLYSLFTFKIFFLLRSHPPFLFYLPLFFSFYSTSSFFLKNKMGTKKNFFLKFLLFLFCLVSSFFLEKVFISVSFFKFSFLFFYSNSLSLKDCFLRAFLFDFFFVLQFLKSFLFYILTFSIFRKQIFLFCKSSGTFFFLYIARQIFFCRTV
jgi:hypothetical protein